MATGGGIVEYFEYLLQFWDNRQSFLSKSFPLGNEEEEEMIGMEGVSEQVSEQ